MRERERIAVGECRAEGRTLTGVAITYRERSPSHAERFEPGAFGLSVPSGRTRWLNLRHDPYAVVAHTANGGLILADTPEALHVEARLPKIPAADLIINGLETGRLGGLSIEFQAKRERRDSDTRVIESAELYGIGVVEHPSYTGSRFEVRGEFRGRGFRARVPYRKKLACDCHRGKSCNTVRFKRGAFDESLEEAEAQITEKDILAITGQYKDAVASYRKGTLTLRPTSDALEIEIPRLPDTQAARDLVEQAGVVPIYARPVFRPPAAGGGFVETDTPEGRVATYEKAELRAILIGTTDRTGGWTPGVFPDPDVNTRGVVHRPHYDRPEYRRGAWL